MSRLIWDNVLAETEYLHIPWSDKENCCDVLERVQMRAVSFVSGFKRSTYEEKLKELHLQTLEDRRKKADMIKTFKIVNGFDNVDESTWFERLSHKIKSRYS